MVNNAYSAGKKLLCGDYSQFTVTGKDYFIKKGRYHRVPALGSVIYFYISSLGRVGHTGYVVDVKELGNNRYKIKTNEGNTSGGEFNRNGGSVAIKEYIFSINDVGGKNRIHGFGYPVFGEDTCTVEELLEVLSNEVGYEEKASNSRLQEKHANVGRNNFTKYGDWYGNNGVYWCQQYVSWGAYAACKKHLENNKTGWEKVEDKWFYRYNGNIIKDQWFNISNRWYVFDGMGRMITGWFKSNEEWYYLNPKDGAMLSGQWVENEETKKQYYLTSSGIMASNCYIKKGDKYYWVNKDGEYEPRYDTEKPDEGYEVIG